MVKKKFTFLSTLLLCLLALTSANAQETVIYRISGNGGQEAIPVRKGETVRNALERISNTQINSIATPNGIVAKLKYYDSTVAASNFGFNHQDVLFAWFKPTAGGTVKSIVWRNYGLKGDIGKGTIRAWKVDPRVATIPVTAGANGSRSAMGYYIDAADGDGGVTAFKDKATNPVYQPAVGNPDSAKVSFDPLGTEAKWLAKGLQVSLDSAKWQGVDMLSWGDSMNFKQNELFGFTLTNDSPPGGADGRMEIWAYGNAVTPFHSYKFYEASRAGNKGWHIRGDFEWQMYAVVEFTEDRGPVIDPLQRLFTTLQTTARTVKATVKDDNPGGGAKGVKSVDLYAKINSGAWVKSAMTGTEPNYTGTLPAANPTDTVSYYSIATDVNNLVSEPSPTYFYTIFKVTNNVLYLYNSRAISGSTILTYAPYYMMKDSATEKKFYDVWDVKSFGKTDIPLLLPSYQLVNEIGGVGGYEDLSAMAETYLAGGKPLARRGWIFADQDHTFSGGWPGTGADTTFTDANVHAKYFGIKALINQDYVPGLTKPWGISVDTSKGLDPVFGFVAAKMKKDTVKFYYEPAYELAPTFTNWMDEITPTTDATVLFKDGTKVLGVTKKAADNSWITYALMFDYLGTNFRTDTVGNLHTAAKKYQWIISAGKVVKNILPLILSIEKVNSVVPGEFALAQNYPNPFNPETQIEYSVPLQSNVEIGIYNILGQKVASLVNTVQTAGNYRATWNGKDSFGKSVATGVYFYQLRAGSHEMVKKMMLMK